MADTPSTSVPPASVSPPLPPVDRPLTPSEIRLALRRPSTMSTDQRTTEDNVVVERETTVKEIKERIAQTWQGGPVEDGMRLIARGRILADTEAVGTALGAEAGDTHAHSIHVVVRKWNSPPPPAPPTSTPTPDPISTPPASQTPQDSESHSRPGTPTPRARRDLLESRPTAGNAAGSNREPIPPMPPLVPVDDFDIPPLPPIPGPGPPLSFTIGNNVAQFPVVMDHFVRLERSQRVAFIDSLLRAQQLCSDRLGQLRRASREERLNSLGLFGIGDRKGTGEAAWKQQEADWEPVAAQIGKLLKDLKWQMGEDEKDEKKALERDEKREVVVTEATQLSEFERVEIGGLPFLLHLPASFIANIPNSTPTPTARHLQALRLQLLRLAKRLLSLAQVVNRINHLALPHVPEGGTGAPGVQALMRMQQQLGRFGPPVPPLAGLGLGNPPIAGAGPGEPAGGRLAFGFGLGPRAGGAPAGVQFAPDGRQIRQYELSINLDLVLRYLPPLIWLSIKLSLLLFFFGRHASAKKRFVLIGLAVLWVVWEGWSIRTREVAERRRRERAVHDARRAAMGAPAAPAPDAGAGDAERPAVAGAAAAPGGAGPPPAAGPPQPPAAPAAPADPLAGIMERAREQRRIQRRRARGINAGAAPGGANGNLPPMGEENIRDMARRLQARGGAFPPGTEVRRMRPMSRLTPKYWITTVAVVGLASEYRELGLHPRADTDTSGNTEAARRRIVDVAEGNLHTKWKRYARNLGVCLVLFVGTLLPEVEKKRRKALERRARIIRAVVEEGNEREAEASARAAAPAQPPQPEGSSGTDTNAAAPTPSTDKGHRLGGGDKPSEPVAGPSNSSPDSSTSTLLPSSNAGPSNSVPATTTTIAAPTSAIASSDEEGAAEADEDLAPEADDEQGPDRGVQGRDGGGADGGIPDLALEDSEEDVAPGEEEGGMMLF